MKRKTRKKLKNAFLKGFTACAAVMWILAILCADSNPTAAMIILYITTAWLCWFGYCNGWFEWRGENDADIQK